MFTGIVQTVGRIAAAEVQELGRRLVVEVGGWRPERGERGEGRGGRAGDSICVSGVCLTVVASPDEGGVGGVLLFDVVGETLGRTTLGALAVGDAVNVEPAVTAMQPLGGHVVQGHVDEVGRVEAVEREGGDWRVRISASAGMLDLLPSKASVTVEGVSLTVAAVHEASFDVALIPTTLARTTLGALAVGDGVNLEADVLAKHVAHLLRRWRGGEAGGGGGVTRELLRAAGFE